MGEPRRGGCSGAEPLASARAPRGNDPAPAFGRHAGAEAVPALADELARLIGTLHGIGSEPEPVALTGSGTEFQKAPLYSG